MVINNSLSQKILILSTMVILLLGCSKATPSPDQLDKSPFTGIPCAAPCWHGLVIGQSNENEVMLTLPTLTFINQDTIRTHRMSMPGLDFSTYAPGVEIIATCISTNKPCLTLDVVDDILTEIEVVLNYEIRLKESIEYLGDPDYVGYRNLGGEQILCEVDIVWSSKQLILSSEVFEGYDDGEDNCGVVRDTGKTSSSLIVSKVWYRSTSAIETMLSIGKNEFFEFSGTIPEK